MIISVVKYMRKSSQLSLSELDKKLITQHLTLLRTHKVDSEAKAYEHMAGSLTKIGLGNIVCAGRWCERNAYLHINPELTVRTRALG